MFASHNPLIYILQTLAVLLVAVGAVIAAVLIHEPLLALISPMALGQMPETPVLPPPGYNQAQAPEPEDPGYDGGERKMGFA